MGTMGRPRESRVDEAILEATRELLREVGYAGLTVDAVAERARIGKAGIYRRYANKQEMVFAAAVHGSDLGVPSDSGGLSADLSVLAQEIIDSLTRPAASAAVLGLLADLSADQDLGARFHDTFVVREQAVIAALLDRAVARGEIHHEPDVAFVHSLLTGPVFATLYLQRREPAGLARRLGQLVADMLIDGANQRVPQRRTVPGTQQDGPATS